MVLRNLRPNRLAPYASLGCLLRHPLWRSAAYTAYHGGDDVEDHGAGHVLERLAQTVLQALDAVLAPPLHGLRRGGRCRKFATTSNAEATAKILMWGIVPSTRCLLLW
jgi:hypothetical protein